MTKVRLFLVGMVVLMLVLHSSCRKFEEYPPEPQITFNDFLLYLNPETGITEIGVLSVQYIDGDGDIGLDQADTLEPYQPGGEFHYNFKVRYFEQQYGQLVEVPVNFNARIPPLIPKDQNRSIKGIIEQEMYVYNPASDFDTIQFKVQLIDRALNISNEVSTPLIIRLVPDSLKAQ